MLTTYISFHPLRSTAVNAQLRSCVVDGVEHPVQKLQDFPRHAKLEEVCFQARDNASLQDLLREASTLRTGCLSSVSTIRLLVSGNDARAFGISSIE